MLAAMQQTKELFFKALEEAVLAALEALHQELLTMLAVSAGLEFHLQ